MSYPDETSQSREYFCNNCGQLRLSLTSITIRCGNCNSTDILIGMVGGLNKEELKEKHKAESEDWHDRTKTIQRPN